MATNLLSDKNKSDSIEYVPFDYLKNIMDIPSMDLIHLIYNCRNNGWKVLEDSIMLNNTPFIILESLSRNDQIRIKQQYPQWIFKSDSCCMSLYDTILYLSLKQAYEEFNIDEFLLIDQFYPEKQRNYEMHRKFSVMNCINILSSSYEFNYPLKKIIKPLKKLGIRPQCQLSNLSRDLTQFNKNPYLKLDKRFFRRSKPSNLKQYHINLSNYYFSIYRDMDDVMNLMERRCKELLITPYSKHWYRAKINTSNQAPYIMDKYGKSFFIDNVIASINRPRPKYIFESVGEDGSMLQMIYYNPDRACKYDFLNFLVILDEASDYILAHRAVKGEKTFDVIENFRRMFEKFHYLPKEIKHDGSSAHTSNEFKEFKLRIKSLFKNNINPQEIEETIIRKTRSKRDNNKAELFFRWFPDKICRYYENYSGFSMKVNDRKLTINPDDFELIKKKPKLLPTKKELILLLDDLIEQWNNRKQKKDNTTPKEKFLSKSTNNAYKLSDADIAHLTWFKKNKVNMTNAGFEFSIKDSTYFYHIPKKYQKAYLEHLHEQKYSIRFHPAHKEIFVFDEQDNFIAIAEPNSLGDENTGKITQQQRKEVRDNHSIIKAEENLKKEKLKQIRDFENEFGIEKSFIDENMDEKLTATDEERYHTLRNLDLLLYEGDPYKYIEDISEQETFSFIPTISASLKTKIKDHEKQQN